MKVTIAPDFAKLLSPLTDEELETLTENIKADPKHERMPPVIVWKHKNTIIDGHNQYRIRTKLGLTVKYAVVDYETRDEAMQQALDVQFGRRNLDASQRSIAYAKLTRNSHGGNRKSDQDANLHLENLEELAEKAGVSERTMQAAAQVVDNSPRKIVDAVAAGEIKVSDAVAVLELTPEQQLAALVKVQEGEASTLRAAAKAGGKISGGVTFDVEEIEAAPERPVENVLDSLKGVVPKSLHEVFLAAATFKSLMSDISRLKGQCNKLRHTKGGAAIDLQELDRHLDQARSILRFAMPYTECPKCRRNLQKKCPACYGNGWIHESMHKSSSCEADIKWLSKR